MHDLAHEPDARRYVLRVAGDAVAVLDYAINGNQISFNHTYTKAPFRGRGFAAQLVGFAVDDVERNSSFRVVPMCWYVADWFDEHADRRGLLARAL